MPDYQMLARTPRGWAILAGIVFMILMTNACHEGGHALAAWWRGDRRASIRARCTLNPIAHFHWFLTLVLPIVSALLLGFVVGGARPVMVDPRRLGRSGLALVALAGPLGNFLFLGFVIAISGLCLRAGLIDDFDQANSPLWLVFVPALLFSLLLGVLNLLPVPPLDGSRVVGFFLPEKVRSVWYALAPVGLIALLVFWIWISQRPEFLRAVNEATEELERASVTMAEWWRTLV